MTVIEAPAKINLTLEVLDERPDGYHEISSVVQTIGLYDRLHFSPAPRISFKCDSPEFVAGESLVSRAAAMLKEISGYPGGANIEIEKRIPLVAGLGGDSSDAAAVLGGLNQLWELGLSAERLLELASELGSDVAFFLYGGAALVEGRGEKVTRLPPLARKWAVLLVPPFPPMEQKTARLYAGLKSGHYTDGRITGKLAKVLGEGRGFKPSLLFNTFENVAFDFFPKLKLYKKHFIKLGAAGVHLAGSGPTLFSIFEDKSRAEDLHTRCKDQGLEAYLAETV